MYVLSNIILAAGFFIVLLLIINIGLHYFGDSRKLSAGTFGDFFGGILNPILTFLTLFGLIATIVIQRQELKLARVEYEKTSNALNTQAVELTFFNLLDLHHKISDNLEYTVITYDYLVDEDISLDHALDSDYTDSGTRTVYKGKDVIKQMLDEITKNIKVTDTASAYFSDGTRKCKPDEMLYA